MKKNKKIISVNHLTKNDFEEIMEKASKKKKVPMIKSEQVGPEEDFANNIEHFITTKNYSSILNKRIIVYISSLLGMKK